MEFIAPVVAASSEYTWYPKEFYARTELGLGIFLGLYHPLMARARNYDCFASFWALGNNLFRWHTFFDNTSPLYFDTFYDWINFLSVPILTGY